MKAEWQLKEQQGKKTLKAFKDFTGWKKVTVSHFQNTPFCCKFGFDGADLQATTSHSAIGTRAHSFTVSRQILPQIETLTALHDPAKDSVVALNRAAVPAVVSELVLALTDPLLSSLADRLHYVWVLLTQLSLLIHQTRHVITYYPCPQSANVP